MEKDEKQNRMGVNPSTPAQAFEEKARRKGQPSAPPSASGAFFGCNTCEAKFFVHDTDYEDKIFVTSCESCNRNLMVQQVEMQQAMDVVELTGCHYLGTERFFAFMDQPTNPNFSLRESSGLHDLEWFSKPSKKLSNLAQSTKIDAQPVVGEFTNESFIPSLISGWEVKCKGGKKYQFQYFSVLRKWIEEGKIKTGDKITPDGDRTYKIEEYPGTADLFGNFVKRSEALKNLGQRPKVKTSVLKPFIKWTTRIVLTVTLLSAAAISPKAWNEWIQLRGSELIANYTVDYPMSDPESITSVLISANQLFYSPAAEGLEAAEGEYKKALAIDPQNSEAISGLAQAFTEKGFRTGKQDFLNKAALLLQYNAKINSTDYLHTKAKARLLWRQGEPKNALDKLQGLSGTNISDPGFHFLMASIAAQLNDHTISTIAFDKALHLDPNNPKYIKGIVDVFKKQGKFQQAAAYQSRLIDLFPDDPKMEKQLIQLYRGYEDWASIETFYRTQLAQENLDPVRAEEYQFELLRLLDQQGKDEALLREALAYVNRFPEGTHIATVRSQFIKVAEESSESANDGGFNPDSPYGANKDRVDRSLRNRARQLRRSRRATRRR